MTQDEIIEMAQECGLIGMRPHLDGIYSEALVAFAKLVAEKALAEHAMRETQRLGQEIEQEPKIKTTDPFESSKVADYNRGWNDCLFASGIVKQPEQEPLAWPCLIDSADFSENTITLVMQCEDYKVTAGQYWLSTTPPKETT